MTRSAAFRFPDTKEAWTVHVRRGVAFIEPRLAEKADITVTVSSLLWKEIATKLTNPAVAMAKGDLKVEGGIASLVKFLYLFMD